MFSGSGMGPPRDWVSVSEFGRRLCKHWFEEKAVAWEYETPSAIRLLSMSSTSRMQFGQG